METLALNGKIFDALADDSRRELLDALHAQRGQSQSELCARLAMSRQGVAKHLGILVDAGLVVVVRQGREKRHWLNPLPLRALYHRWIRKFDEEPADALLELKNVLELST